MNKDNFYGRKFYLDILEKRICDLIAGYRQNIAIIGDECIGKTSLLFQLLNKFSDNRVVISYLQILPQDLPSFGRRFIGTLLYNFLLNSNIVLEENLDFLLRKASSFIPQTTEKMRKILTDLEAKRKENIFTELLSLTESIYRETGKFSVVIFDEFHHLDNLGIKSLYVEWSKLLVQGRTTLYIISSSARFRTEKILSKELSLLFGNFEVIYLEPFDIKTAEGYLQEVLHGSKINPGLKNFLVHFTGGHPFYLKTIARAILESGEDNLINILDDFLFSPDGSLNQLFVNELKSLQDKSCSQDYLAILYLISNGHNKIKDIRHILQKSKKEIDAKISQLCEWDAISHSGDFVKINDRVFSFWLKFVYQEKLRSFTFDDRNQRGVFRKRLEEMLQEFLVQAQKSVPERMVELLRLFDDEAIQLERRKLRLAHFREIKPLEFNHRGLKEGLLCRAQNSLWIMAFKYDLLTEEDIVEFVQECQKFRHHNPRKIIVTLSEIDINSHLRALEEKIWTWDINKINQLLDLFSQPRIVI